MFSCKDCTKRHPGCHGTCETYLAERAEYDRLKSAYDHKKEIDGGLAAQRSKKVYDATRYRRYKNF